MFREFPSRRITERRKNLLSILNAGVALTAGIAEYVRTGRFDKWMIVLAAIFAGCLIGYFKKQHEDPWDPPEQ